MEHREEIKCVINISYGETSLLVSGSIDRSIKIWKCKDFSLVETLKRHRGTILSLLHMRNCNKNLLLSGSEDLIIKIWDINSSWACVGSLEGHSGGIKKMLKIDTSDKNMIFGSLGGEVKLWNLNAKKRKKEIIINPEDRHAEPVNCLINIGKNLIATGGNDIRLWYPATGKLFKILKEEKSRNVSTLIYIPSDGLYSNDSQEINSETNSETNSPLLACVENSNCVEIWRINSNELLYSIDIGYTPNPCLLYIPPVYKDFSQTAHLEYIPKEKVLLPPMIAVAEGFSVVLYDILSGKKIKSIDRSSPILMVHISEKDDRNLIKPRTNYIICLENCYYAKIWDLYSKNVQKKEVNKDGRNKNEMIRFETNSNKNIFCTWENNISFWEINTKQELMKNDESVTSATFFMLNSRKTIALGFNQGYIQIWDIFAKDFQFLTNINAHYYEVAVLLEFAENILVSGSNSGVIKVWDVPKQLLLRTVDLDVSYSSNQIYFINKIEGRNLLAVIYDSEVIIVDIDTGEKLLVVPDLGHSQRDLTTISLINNISNSAMIVSVYDNISIKASDVYSGEVIKTFSTNDPYMSIIDISSYFNSSVNNNVNSERKVIAQLHYEGSIEIRDFWTDEIIKIIKRQSMFSYNFTFIPPPPQKSALFALTSLVEIEIWSLEEEKQIGKIEYKGFNVRSIIAVPKNFMLKEESPDSPVLIYGSSTGIQQLDPYTLELHKNIDLNDVFSLLYIPPSDHSIPMIAVGFEEGAVHLMDLRTWERIRILKGHTKRVDKLVLISKDSCPSLIETHLIVSSGQDKNICVWNPYSEDLIHTIITDTSYLFYIPPRNDCLYETSASQLPLIASCRKNGEISYFNPLTAEFISIHPVTQMGKVEFSLEIPQKSLFIIGNDEISKVFNSSKFEVIKYLKICLPVCLPYKGDLVIVGAPCDDETDKHNNIPIIDSETLETIKILTNPHKKKITSLLDLLIEGRSYLVSGGEDSLVFLHDVENDSILFEFKEHFHPIKSICYFTYGKRTVFISGDKDGVLKIMNISGVCLLTINHGEGVDIKKIQLVEKDSQVYLAVFNGNNINLWLISFVKNYTTIKGNYKNYLLQEMNY